MDLGREFRAKAVLLRFIEIRREAVESATDNFAGDEKQTSDEVTGESRGYAAPGG